LSDSSYRSSSRRRFLQQTAAMGLLYNSRHSFAQLENPSHPMGSMAGMQRAPNAPDARAPMLHVLQLPPFVDPLPLPPPLGKPSPAKLKITMREIHAKIHRDVPLTRMWSYGPNPLGPIIEARSGQPIEIEWINNLPTQHFLPIDHSLHGCGRDIPDVRTVTHLHGAKVPSKDDGYPEDWFASGKSRISHYPLEQESATLWYHDHAMGLNRLNTYAGLTGLFLIRDQVEDSLHLPTGKYEVPLVLCDRYFTTDGQLFYGTSGDPEHPWIPEFTADGILINGKLRPFFEVEPRLYRFRIVNVSNSRFFALSFDNKHPFLQIGSDQGLLPAPVEFAYLNIAPAERADILIDLSQFADQTIHLRTGAYDILQLRVAKQATSLQNNSIPKTIRPIPRIPESDAVVIRTITLNEFQDKVGNPMIMLLNRKRWHEPTTEFPKLNTTEIWEFVNETEDTHPMHLHLVRFQILDRRTFDVFDYQMNKHLRFRSQLQLPAPNELGWKDTVQCPAGMITRVIVRFEGYTGKYLYHCHILEHEANDMMRPFEVIA
jgi:spore coat protein A